MTGGALGCQYGIACGIRQRGGDYVLALTDNQPTRHESVTHRVVITADEDATDLALARYQTVGKDHSRIKTRRWWVSDNPKGLQWRNPRRAPPDGRSVAAAENVAVLRHIALYLLCQDRTGKAGITAKRRRCGGDEADLLHVLAASIRLPCLTHRGHVGGPRRPCYDAA